MKREFLLDHHSAGDPGQFLVELHLFGWWARGERHVTHIHEETAVCVEFVVLKPSNQSFLRRLFSIDRNRSHKSLSSLQNVHPTWYLAFAFVTTTLQKVARSSFIRVSNNCTHESWFVFLLDQWTVPFAICCGQQPTPIRKFPMSCYWQVNGIC
jgi:hypothetical protein